MQLSSQLQYYKHIDHILWSVARPFFLHNNTIVIACISTLSLRFPESHLRIMTTSMKISKETLLFSAYNGLT